MTRALALRTLACLLLGGLLLAAPPAEAQTKTLRGQIVRSTSNDTYPLRSVAVRLRTPNGQRSNAVYTNDKGYFYFHNVPGGRYTLDIRVRGRKESFVRAIRVPNTAKAHEVRAITLSF
jgi:hypothetical protein